MFEGMASLYKKNPHERRAAITAKVAENAGFAAPFLYASMGADIKKAEDYDTELSGQVKTYMGNKQKLENAKFAKDNEKNIQDTITWAMDTGKKIWDATPGEDDEIKSKAVTTMINDRLVSAGVPPIKNIFFDKHGQISFEMVISQNEDGSYSVRNGRRLANGVLEVEDGTDEKGQPVFRPAKPNETTLEKAMGLKDLQTPLTPKGDFELFYSSQKKLGLSDNAISKAWEERKVKIAKESKSAPEDKSDIHFLTATNNLDSLYRAKASTEKGFDPLTGAVIPQTNIDSALATIKSQIAAKERFISKKWPTQWTDYKGTGEVKSSVAADVMDTYSKGLKKPYAGAAGGIKEPVQTQMPASNNTQPVDGDKVKLPSGKTATYNNGQWILD